MILVKLNKTKMIGLLGGVILIYIFTIIFCIKIFPNIHGTTRVKSITVNGKISRHSEVYILSRQRHRYLIRLEGTRDPATEEIFLLDLTMGDKGVIGQPPGNSSGLYFFAGYLYNYLGDNLKMVRYDGTLAKTNNFNAGLTFKYYHYCQFRTLSSDIIRITFLKENPLH